MLISQPGSTRYPLNEFQMRQAARVQLEYIFLFDQNKSMYDMLRMYEKARIQDSISSVEKDKQLAFKEDQINNRQLKFVTMEAKYKMSQDQIKAERKRKRLYAGTTVAALALLTISLFN